MSNQDDLWTGGTAHAYATDGPQPKKEETVMTLEAVKDSLSAMFAGLIRPTPSIEEALKLAKEADEFGDLTNEETQTQISDLRNRLKIQNHKVTLRK